MNIETSLLREKFIIKEHIKKPPPLKCDLTALSNRMPIKLQAGEMPSENFIVRASSMHCCARFVTQLIIEHNRLGPLLNRAKTIDWYDLWDNSQSKFDRMYHPERWVALYHKGKIIFSEGRHHPFLDIIEQCDAMNKKSYEHSVDLAKNAFLKAGKNLDIELDSNVALVCALARAEARSSMIIRGPGRTSTFNLSIKPQKTGDRVNPIHGLSMAADILESVQLSYTIGMNTEKLNLGMIEKYSDDDYATKDARKRLNELNMQINSIESQYIIRYRPERPNFEHIINITERYIRNNILDDSTEEYIQKN